MSLARPLPPAIVLYLAAAACGPPSGDVGSQDSTARPTVSAKTAVVATGPFNETLDAIGTVVPRAGHMAVLSAPAPARVARVFVTAGQHVRRAMRLVELDQAPFRTSTESAEAALETAQSAYERAQRLVGAGIAPRKEMEQAAAELARARAEAAGARRAQTLSVLRSPLDGVVTQMNAILGASVDANQRLVEVADPTAPDVLLGVTPADAARIRPNDRIAFRAGQSARGQPLGEGVVLEVGGIVDSATRTVAIRSRAPEAGARLRFGETLFGQITVATRSHAITVPLQALVPEGEGFKVFVVDRQGLAQSRRVVLGTRTDSLAEVTSGLRAGERVVTSGAYGVEDSARVRPDTS
jgi:membrane fusion protein (multidrug efflux system)